MNGTLNTNLQNTSNVNKAYADIKVLKKELEALENDVSENTLDINSLSKDVSNIKSDISEQVTTKNIATENISISNAAHALNSLTVDGEITADKISVKELNYDVQGDISLDNLTTKNITISDTADINNETVNYLRIKNTIVLPDSLNLISPTIDEGKLDSPTLTGDIIVNSSLLQFSKNIALGLDDNNKLCKVLIQGGGSSTTNTFVDKNSIYFNPIKVAGAYNSIPPVIFNNKIYFPYDGKLYNDDTQVIYTFTNKPKYTLQKFSENEAYYLDTNLNLYLFNIDTLTETLVAENVVGITGVYHGTSYGQAYVTGSVGAYTIHYLGQAPEDASNFEKFINSGIELEYNILELLTVLNNNYFLYEKYIVRPTDDITSGEPECLATTFNIDNGLLPNSTATIDESGVVSNSFFVSNYGYVSELNFIENTNTQYCKINDKIFILGTPKYIENTAVLCPNGIYYLPSSKNIGKYIENNSVMTTEYGATVLGRININDESVSTKYKYFLYALENNYIEISGTTLKATTDVLPIGKYFLVNGNIYDYVIYNGNYYCNEDTSTGSATLNNCKVYIDSEIDCLSGPSDYFINCDIEMGHLSSFDALVNNMTFRNCNIHKLKQYSLNESFLSDTENNFDDCFFSDDTVTSFSCNKFENSYISSATMTSFKANEVKNSNLKFTKNCTLSHMGTKYISSGTIKVNVVNSITKNAVTTNCNLINCSNS